MRFIVSALGRSAPSSQKWHVAVGHFCGLGLTWGDCERGGGDALCETSRLIATRQPPARAAPHTHSTPDSKPRSGIQRCHFGSSQGDDFAEWDFGTLCLHAPRRGIWGTGSPSQYEGRALARWGGHVFPKRLKTAFAFLCAGGMGPAGV